jgi:hypothetical protein
MMASLIAFKAMLTGNLAALQQLYQLKFSTTESVWRLEMTANETAAAEQPLKIIMQGLSEQAANRMEVIFPDGDRSLYVLSKPRLTIYSAGIRYPIVFHWLIKSPRHYRPQSRMRRYLF